MASRSRPASLLAALLLVTTTVAACSGSSKPSTATGSSESVAEQLARQLDALPTVDGSVRTAQQEAATSLSRTYRVPAGTPACLQILARLDASGFSVVTGAASDTVQPDTCLTTSAADPGGEDQGTGTILAAGGSQVALTWSATTYTVTATD